MSAFPQKWHERTINAARIAPALLLCLLIFRPWAAWSGSLTGTEYEVKTGFIYNFANFVVWPVEAFRDNQEELVLCFVSGTPDADVLFKLNDQIIRGRRIKVIAYTREDCLDASHILYLATQDRPLIQKLLAIARERSILTIGEIEGFSQMGGIINFFEEQNRLRFKVNIDAVKRAGLTISSQLLRSAQIYREARE